jgi:hypothetical protein
MNWRSIVKYLAASIALLAVVPITSASAQGRLEKAIDDVKERIDDRLDGKKRPNILFIMGDDIGWMQPSIYHQGLMVGETPNIDRIAQEGGKFMTYYAEQSCTAGRTAFFTGMTPLRAGMIPPQ